MMKGKAFKVRAGIWMFLVACLGGSAAAGPNAGGLLVLHDASLLVSATDGSLPLCGQGVVPSGLDGVDARIDGADSFAKAAVFKVYAIFSSSPRLMGLTFGVRYTDIMMLELATGPCGDLELPDQGWPASGTGNAILWDAVQTASVVPVYAFSACMYSWGRPSTLDLVPHPTEGGTFWDDQTPAVFDPVAGYGKIGFDMDGVVPPPDGERGACCDRMTGECQNSLWHDCVEDIWHGAGTVCETTDCGLGGCCLGSGGDCVDTTAVGCLTLGGSFLGLDRPCSSTPPPCETEGRGACCNTLTGACKFLTEEECAQAAYQHEFLGPTVACAPNPCPPPPPPWSASPGARPGQATGPAEGAARDSEGCAKGEPVEHSTWGRIKSGYR